MVAIKMAKKLENGISSIRGSISKILQINLIFSGGGLYDEVDSVKIGGWIDLSESFSSSS